MGLTSSKSSSPNPNFTPSQWITDINQSNEQQNQYGKITTLKNRNTDKLIDKYQYMLTNKQDYNNYIKSFQWRKNQQFIVKSLYLVTKNQNKYCSNTYIVQLYLEHPKNRLSDFSDIPYPDTLYLLKSMLSGYYKLYNNVGKFPIKDQQVCIDQGGYVRVWLNQNLSRNYPQQWQIQPRIKPQTQQQQQMVEQIIQLIEHNCDHEQQPKPNFYNYYHKKKINKYLGFQQTIALIQQYARINNTIIPQYFISVVEVYQDQDQLYQLANSNNNFSNTEKKDDSYMSGRDKKINKQESSCKYNHNNKSNNHSRKSSYDRHKQNKNQGEIYRLSHLSKLQQNNNQNNHQKSQNQLGFANFNHNSNTNSNSNINININGRKSQQFNKSTQHLLYNHQIPNSSILPYNPPQQNYSNIQTQPNTQLFRKTIENKHKNLPQSKIKIIHINNQNIIQKINQINHIAGNQESKTNACEKYNKAKYNGNQGYQEQHLNTSNTNQNNPPRPRKLSSSKGNNQREEQRGLLLSSHSRQSENKQAQQLSSSYQTQNVQMITNNGYKQEDNGIQYRGTQNQERENIYNGGSCNQISGYPMNPQLSFRNLSESSQLPSFNNNLYPIQAAQPYPIIAQAYKPTILPSPISLNPCFSFQEVVPQYIQQYKNKKQQIIQKQTFYYTLFDSIALDPQIVKDMKNMNIDI